MKKKSTDFEGSMDYTTERKQNTGIKETNIAKCCFSKVNQRNVFIITFAAFVKILK